MQECKVKTLKNMLIHNQNSHFSDQKSFIENQHVTHIDKFICITD